MTRMRTLTLGGVLLSLAFLGSSCNKQPVQPQENPYPEASAQGTETEQTSIPKNAQNFVVNVQESSVLWRAAKVTLEHNGAISIQSGSLALADGLPVAGEFIIDMTSIQDFDLEGDPMHERLLNHLQSDDFFSVQTHPTATFTLTGSELLEDGTVMISGDLEIKGILNPITFPATISVENDVATAQATVEVDRTLYDIRFGSGKFFSNLGDSLIDDTFTLELDLIAELS